MMKGALNSTLASAFRGSTVTNYKSQNKVDSTSSPPTSPQADVARTISKSSSLQHNRWLRQLAFDFPYSVAKPRAANAR
jgi:hypothetical protein